ncbi:MAG: OmpA family protein [Myxococcaceae bacterium]|nr:MAG: OmpA family protein [Myxococcaceae bacterium]
MRPIKLTVALALATAGCSAPFTYPDLAKAKDTYAHATKTGDPKQFPKEFDDAKKSIGAAQSAQDAQASFERGKDPSRERDLATEALYKAEIADGTVAAAKSGADRTAKEEELAVLQKEWDEKGALANDAAARAEAERAANEAAAARLRMQKFADVKEDERGTIITLAGGIPFKTGKADLQKVAIDRLKIVAEALKGTTRTILVEGHTDSTGRPETNMTLSQARAETVRKYLIDGGIPADQIRAVGAGQDRPVADNKTSAGRAKNRRVEVILEKPKSS